jgi:glycosyltransferase involved in cell wall biosynthesis
VGNGTSGGSSLKQPIKILYTIPNFITAGSGRAMLNIIQRLNRDWFAPAVCVSKLGGRLDDVVRTMDIPLIEAPFMVPAKPYLSLYARARAFAQVFKPYGFDLWHSFHYGDDYSEPIIARLSGAKAWVYTKKNMNWHKNAWYVRSLLASGIAAQNTDMLKVFFNRWPLRSKVKLITRGVDTKKFKPDDQLMSEWRKILKIANNTLLVGCIAHLVPVKGHTLLIDAASKCADVHLLFTGRVNDPAYLTRLQTQVDQLGVMGKVHFPGNIADVPNFITQMDIIALPTLSRGEGCPVALLEAMACAKACIATDVPGSRDLIQDGVSGLLVPPEDSEALGRAIQNLAMDPDLRARLGAAARQRVEGYYTLDREVAAHEQFYMEILRSKLKPNKEKIDS